MFLAKFAVPNAQGLALWIWRCGRVVDGGSLENCCAATHRGFESLRLRAMRNLLNDASSSFSFIYASNPRNVKELEAYF